MDIILSHNNCPDGWCAAYICKRRYPEAEIVLLNHGLDAGHLEGLIEVTCKDKDVIMVDYSLRTRELNDRLNAAAKSFRILDHHKTAQAVLEGAEYATFDMKRSGAGLAWDYLFGEDSGLHPDTLPYKHQFVHEQPVCRVERPWWVNYTEDQDLWNWALTRSQEVNAYLMVQPRTLEAWNVIADQDKMEVTAAVRQGIGVRSYIEYYTRSVVAEIQEGVFVFEGRNLRTAVLNIPYVGVSEAGNAAVQEGYDLALLWFERADGQIQFSLRSLKGGVDASAIAKTYGGGGHQAAAGFQTNLEKGRWIVDWVLGRNKNEQASYCC